MGWFNDNLDIYLQHCVWNMNSRVFPQEKYAEIEICYGE